MSAGGRLIGAHTVDTGSIHMVSDQGGGTFGGATEILPAVSGKNRYYPSFSPDNKLLVFNESTCPTGAQHIDCNADSDPTVREVIGSYAKYRNLMAEYAPYAFAGEMNARTQPFAES